MKRRKLNLQQPAFVADSGYRVWELAGCADGAKLHSVAYVVVRPGDHVDKHFHRNSEESYYFLKGRAEMVVNGTTYTFGPNEICFLEPDDRHELKPLGNGAVEFLAISGPAFDATDYLTDHQS